MPRFRLLQYFVFVLLFVASSKGQTAAGTVNPSTTNGAAPSTVDSLSKQAIEHKFLSANPVPLPEADGAIPGSKVIEARRRRAASQLDRVRTAEEVHPMGGGSTTNLPGLQFRANQPAGGIPTAVVAGMPNRITSKGVISDPRPTPVSPTSSPTINPDIEYAGWIEWKI